MREIINSILILMAFGFFTTVQAQVTAVMQARVNIISGAGLSGIEESNIDLSTANSVFNETVKTGSFTLTATPGADVAVYISKTTELKNEAGDVIEIESLTVDHQYSASGEHSVSIGGKIKNEVLRNGNYKGNVTTVIEYL